MPLTSLTTSGQDLLLLWKLNAASKRVWQCLTQPELLSQWLGELEHGQIAADQLFRIDHGDGYLCESTVQAFQPQIRLAYTWKFADEHDTGVNWQLMSDGQTTELLLTHSGLADLLDSYRAGWLTHLLYLEAATLGAPLPPEMFWALHATVQQLRD